ncbi:hypothetical protein MPC1_7370002 [Methylocella tundrae]|nr:hypothetical protein MPC1_7370002 [Methylocella tundrae]
MYKRQGPVRQIDDDDAAQTLCGATSELGARHPQEFAQEIVHRQIVAHVHGAVSATVDRQGKFRHASARFSIS